MQGTTLRNRLLIAAGMWKESTSEPLPKMAPGDPREQIEGFEITLVEMLFRNATPDTAREVAEKTWTLVHDRSDDDVVKRRVTEIHEELARLTHGRSG